MKSLRALLGNGLLCGMVAIALAQPVMAAEEANPQAASTAPAEAAANVAEDAEPSATLELASEQMRLIMGGTAGKGVLHFGGKDYAFTFKTASAGLGMKMVKEVSAVGKVYSLEKVEDFAGKYTAVSQAAIAGKSEVDATYTSDKGVVIKLHGTVKGAGLSLGAGIATIELVKE